ncbi:MAG: glycosyltransferase family 2 protein [Clostridium sp.]|nr:glycosyltransferase family 2 protein [Clostridium sp.]
MSSKLISVIVPVYNEELNIVPMYERVSNVFDKLEYNFEIIYVDNCSVDRTPDKIRELASLHKNVHGIVMSRNFGSSQPSEIAGINYSRGDAVVLIDGDIQDPPELIEDFVQKWEEGFEVVYGVRKRRRGSIIRRFAYKMFYRVFKMLSYIDIPLDAGDFGLIDRKVVEEIKGLRENEVFIRGLRAWVGFKQCGIEYTRDDRLRGKTSYSLRGNVKWAKMGIFNFSYKPLEFISKMAFVMTFFAMIGIVYYVVLHFVYDKTPYGFSTQVILTLFLSSLQLFALGIMGEYIARIFNEVKGRPRYIVREIINQPSSNQKNATMQEIINERGTTNHDR